MTRAPSPQPATPWRRIAAFAFDYLILALYIGLLALFMFTLGDGLTGRVRALWQAHLLGFATLTLPVVLYFAVSEASPAGGTVGKRVTGIAVVSDARGSTPEGMPFFRSLVRAAIKFLPWELSHAAIYRIPGWPTDPAAPGTWQVLAFGVSLALALWFLVSLFLGSGRTPYDRLAGSRVVRRPDIRKGVLA